MGQSSSHVWYKARKDPDRPKDCIGLWHTYGSRGGVRDFYVDFDDEGSLLRELLRFDMAGIYVARGGGPVWLYLIEDDEELMKTSILLRGDATYYAIYSSKYQGLLDYYVGGKYVERWKRSTQHRRRILAEYEAQLAPQDNNELPATVPQIRQRVITVDAAYSE